MGALMEVCMRCLCAVGADRVPRHLDTVMVRTRTRSGHRRRLLLRMPALFHPSVQVCVRGGEVALCAQVYVCWRVLLLLLLCVCACARARVCVCVCVCLSVQGMCMYNDRNNKKSPHSQAHASCHVHHS